jgi:hypothetical protein
MVEQEDELVPWVEPVAPECVPAFALLLGEWTLPIDEPLETPHDAASAGRGAPIAAAATNAASATAQEVVGRRKALVRMSSSSRRRPNGPAALNGTWNRQLSMSTTVDDILRPLPIQYGEVRSA